MEYVHMHDGSYQMKSLTVGLFIIVLIKKISVVRLVINTAVMSERLCSSSKDKTRFKSEREIFIVDLEIVRAMLQKESYGITMTNYQNHNDQ